MKFWGIADVPFTYDELSAVFRAQATTWNEHWQQGVMPDGHPPGMQTLIWLWIRTFGESVPLMHGIMACCSLGSAFFIYKATELLFSKPKALAVVLLYTLSYLPLIWGNQIRPYTLGMFFCNAFFWQWSIIWTGKTNRYSAFIFLGIWAGISIWMHYFTALPVLILGIFGIIKQGEQRGKWLLSAATGMLLFTPALSVFAHQMGIGGLDWLGKPGIDFPLKHLQYLLNGMLYAVLGIWISSFFVKPQPIDKKSIERALLCFSVFLFPMIIGFAWSWLQKPVLQHTVLLFSAPFFFMGLISLIHEKKIILIAPAMALMLGYGLMKSAYFGDGRKNVYHEQAKVIKSQCGQKALLLADGPDDVLLYHLFNEHSVCIPAFISHSNIPFSYQRLWEKYREKPFYGIPIILAVNSGSHPGIVPLLEHWTGKASRHQYFTGGEVVYLNESNRQENVTYNHVNIETHKPFDIPLKNMGYQKNDLLVFHLVDDSLPEDAELIGSLHNGDHQIDWRSSKKSEFRGIGDNRIFLFIKTADIPGVSGNTRLSIYLKTEKTGIKTRIEYRLCRANPNMYGPAWFE